MFAVCCCSLLTLASSSVYKPRLVFPAQLIRPKTSGVRAGEGTCSEPSPTTSSQGPGQGRAAKQDQTKLYRAQGPQEKGGFSHSALLLLAKLDWTPTLPVLGDPRSQGWIPLHQWDHRLVMEGSELSSALAGPKEPARDFCLSHHTSCIQNSSPSWRKDFLGLPPPAASVELISDTAKKKEINQERTGGAGRCPRRAGGSRWTVSGR